MKIVYNPVSEENLQLVTSKASEISDLTTTLDSRYINVTGDTMTGDLVLFDNTVHVKDYTMTIPASLTVAGLEIENLFTAGQTITGSANVTQLKVVGNATQTTLIEFNNSAGQFLYTLSGLGINFFRAYDSGTNTKPVAFKFGHSTSGTPAAGIGLSLQYTSDHTGAVSGQIGLSQYFWVNATSATRLGKIIHYIDDYGGTRNFETITTNGTYPNIACLASVYVTGGVDVQQFIVKANATQTANILEVQKSDATVYGGFDGLGRVFSYGNPAVTSNFFASGSANATISGTNNIGFGTGAFAIATSATENIGIGYNAFYYLINGTGNVAIGIGAGQGIRNQSNYNIAIGDRAIASTTAGYNTNGNIAIGRSALSVNYGGYNTAIGYYAGAGLTSGGLCVFLGYYAGYRQTTLSNLLIIDNQVRASAAEEATNAILYGVMAALPANQTLAINAVVSITQGLGVTGNLGFYGTTPIAQATELTDELTTVTFTAPGTPDYALADLIDSSAGACFGFSTKDEGNTVLSVIANLQARVNELETKLVAYGLLADAD